MVEIVSELSPRCRVFRRREMCGVISSQQEKASKQKLMAETKTHRRKRCVAVDGSDPYFFSTAAVFDSNPGEALNAFTRTASAMFQMRTSPSYEPAATNLPSAPIAMA